jgi:heat shock protein HslJ
MHRVRLRSLAPVSWALLLAALACRARTPAPAPAAGGSAPADSVVPPPQTGAAMSIEGVDWMLVALAGRPALAEGAPPTLRLDPATHRAAGDASCNRFTGPYTLAGDSLRFGPLVSTRRACVSAERTAQETAFLGALERTRRWTVSADTLRLLGESGEVARLRR